MVVMLSHPRQQPVVFYIVSVSRSSYSIPLIAASYITTYTAVSIMPSSAFDSISALNRNQPIRMLALRDFTVQKIVIHVGPEQYF